MTMEIPTPIFASNTNYHEHFQVNISAQLIENDDGNFQRLNLELIQNNHGNFQR